MSGGFAKVGDLQGMLKTGGDAVAGLGAEMLQGGRDVTLDGAVDDATARSDGALVQGFNEEDGRWGRRRW